MWTETFRKDLSVFTLDLLQTALLWQKHSEGHPRRRMAKRSCSSLGRSSMTMMIMKTMGNKLRLYVSIWSLCVYRNGFWGYSFYLDFWCTGDFTLFDREVFHSISRLFQRFALFSFWELKQPKWKDQHKGHEHYSSHMLFIVSNNIVC